MANSDRPQLFYTEKFLTRMNSFLLNINVSDIEQPVLFIKAFLINNTISDNGFSIAVYILVKTI